MAWSAFTSYMDRLFKSPAGAYWGKLVDDSFESSERMMDLVVAIFLRYNPRNEQRGIALAGFNALLSNFSFEPLDSGAAGLPPKALRELAMCYYTGQSMEYTMAIEEEGSSIPLLTINGLALWLCCQLHSAPEATLMSLNKLLADSKHPLHIPASN